MNYDEILKKIIRRYGNKADNIRMAQIIESKLKKRAATYADAGKYAQDVGKALTDAFREYLPEALTDGMLYRAAAEVLVDQPMKTAGKDIAQVAEAIQRELNEAAGIGIKPIIPYMNQDQIDGMITGICNAESYEAGEDNLMAQVGNCLEGYVDDFVRENADFQYKAGLSPKIERKTVGKCCEWCSKLAGTYDYIDVSDRGNDVFRRHKNCHCLVLVDPGDGSKRRQDVHSKRWTDEGKADRIAKSEQNDGSFHQRIHDSELKNGLPLKGTPNSITDRLSDTGTVLQRRKYGPDGYAKVDYDLSDHGEKKKHPTGAHKHVFDYSKGEKPRRLNVDMTMEDLIENADIIIKGVNYHEQR